MFHTYSPFPTQLFSRQTAQQDQCDAGGKTEFIGILELIDFFFISHPPLGRKEGRESERVMYFYESTDFASSTDTSMIDRQTDITGLAEAVVDFTSSFCADQSGTSEHAHDSSDTTDPYPHRFVNSTNWREIIMVVEGGLFLIGAGMNRKKCKTAEYFLHPPTLKAMMVRVYESFRLLHGPFHRLMGAVPLPEFKLRLDRFFSTHLSLLRLNKLPLLDLFPGVNFMPLSSVDYLEVECLVSRCVEQFKEVHSTMFLYQTRLIQSSVSKTDLIALYDLLTQRLIPFSMRSELQPETARRRADSRHTGTFITGFSDDEDEYTGELSPSDGMFPLVRLQGSGGNDKEKTFELICYRCLNATICLFVDVDVRSTLAEDYLDRLADFLDERMCALASKIGESVLGVSKTISADIPFHFIYFNPDSLSLRTSFASTIAGNSPSSSGPPISSYNLIYQSFDHFASDSKQEFTQINVKSDDCWMVVKKSNGRILILFISSTTSSQSTIIDIYETTEKIIKSHFNHVFIS